MGRRERKGCWASGQGVTRGSPCALSVPGPREGCPIKGDLEAGGTHILTNPPSRTGSTSLFSALLKESRELITCVVEWCLLGGVKILPIFSIREGRSHCTDSQCNSSRNQLVPHSQTISSFRRQN